MLRKVLLCFITVACMAAVCLADVREAHATGYTYSDVEAIIDATWPDDEQELAKAIAWRESGYQPTAYNPYSGSYCLFQFMPETLWYLGLTYAEASDPWVCSAAAARLQDELGWAPWALTAY